MKYAKPRQLADAISVTTDALRKQRERGTGGYILLIYSIIMGLILIIDFAVKKANSIYFYQTNIFLLSNQQI